MLTMTAQKISKFFGLAFQWSAEKPEKQETEKRPVPGSKTATLRALTDLGESVASGVHVIYSSVRLYLCVAMEPKPDALCAQKEQDRHTARGMIEVDEMWSAAEVNARWARRAKLVDASGREIENATVGARGLTDAGAKEVFFEFNALDNYPDEMYLSDGVTRIRVC